MGRRVELKTKQSTSVLKACKENKIKIKSFCTVGMCGKCTVKVLEGDVSPPNTREKRKLGDENIKKGYRLACQTSFSNKVTIEV